MGQAYIKAVGKRPIPSGRTIINTSWLKDSKAQIPRILAVPLPWWLIQVISPASINPAIPLSILHTVLQWWGRQASLTTLSCTAYRLNAFGWAAASNGDNLQRYLCIYPRPTTTHASKAHVEVVIIPHQSPRRKFYNFRQVFESLNLETFYRHGK